MLAVQQLLLRRPCTALNLRRWMCSAIPPSPAENRTIFALSTPPGKGGVAVVRVSGPKATAVWERVVRPASVAGGAGKSLGRPRSRRMYRCRVVDTSANGAEENLDDGLAVFFQAPNSYTTEPTMELHLHSSPATLKRILSLLSRLEGVRPAERGEFTKRAYLAGRINLLQAEGLKDLIEAETEAQRKTAWDAFGGDVGARMESLRAQVVSALAMVEALIDFGEGEDIEEGVYEEALQRVQKLRETINHHIHDSRRGEILRSGVKVSIFGPPNAGKSSLLNHLAQRETAIVTPIPGTTRDVLETSLDIAGLPVRLFDTAGLRHTEDLVEKIGIERAQKAVQGADISLCVLSLPRVLEGGRIPSSVTALFTPTTLVLLNKADLVPPSAAFQTDLKAWKVSLATGAGMSGFVEDLGKLLKERYEFHGDQTPLVTQNRHRVHLQRAVEFLDAFLRTSPMDVVIAAEELRYAAQEIGKITGGVEVEDVLDAVFREFCIGK